MKKTHLALTCALLTTFIAMADPQKNESESGAEPLEACALPSHAATSSAAEFVKTDEEWQRLLNPQQYRVLRQHGTEPAFRNPYWDLKDKGVYLCAGCEAPLFASKHKYDSRTGWPSFFDTIEPQYIGTTVDTSYGMTRTEAHCSRCGGHLGHVFDDGPKPTRLRYCINSASLRFVPAKDLADHGLEAYADSAK